LTRESVSGRRRQGRRYKMAILQDTERILLWSRHFATLSPLVAAARNTFPHQLQTNFESFPNNCLYCVIVGSLVTSL
jgi:hypothetical protein